jgi:hypothetical protein
MEVMRSSGKLITIYKNARSLNPDHNPHTLDPLFNWGERSVSRPYTKQQLIYISVKVKLSRYTPLMRLWGEEV